MKLLIHLFAGLAERIGSSRLEFQYPDTACTAGSLKTKLAEQYPDAASLIRTSFVAVNQEYTPDAAPLKEDDEIALIPPVSGGSGTDPDQPVDHITEDGMYVITYLPLSVEEVTGKVITANHGASISFVGTTREMTGNQRTVHLEYEAYIPMALKQMSLIGSEIFSRWPGTRCAISHRLGIVDIAGISVIIAISAPHRDTCYEASRYAIERLKQTVPIWKKEIWEDGSEWKGHQLGPWDPTVDLL
ncbi:molybdopterin converting factor subunit 1 [Paenibacillus sp. JX-17]|uniref:Molybdopterin converting factor subunit 1 n=1 Tax=Paenibacillus lacisoli TaxID=3064525 RepID=A0ABT9CGT8_9BACL|nr:molybdopterin converting factor subunit 1 [Paenibacillus sp. JX-17]MDO7908481.1 molybdopterin converting factor subunit 1 [Paenibacillus sp. JX-17]